MYCPECGTKLPGDEKFCHECGFNVLKYMRGTSIPSMAQERNSHPVDPQAIEREVGIKQEEIGKQEELRPNDKNRHDSFNKKYKIDIVAMIVLHVLTAGVYLSAWLYQRYNMIELRFGTNKLSKGAPKAAIFFYSLLLCIRFIMPFVDRYYYENAYMTLAVISLISMVFYLLFFYSSCYRIRTILNELKETRTVSSLWTFLFRAFYLQYKMNRLVEWSGAPPSLPIFKHCYIEDDDIAICSGCNEETKKYMLYYNKDTNTYYHRFCAPEGVILRD